GGRHAGPSRPALQPDIGLQWPRRPCNWTTEAVLLCRNCGRHGPDTAYNAVDSSRVGTGIAFNPGICPARPVAKVSLTMKQLATFAALGVMAFGALAGGCYSPEHRQEVAADRDADRRAAFDHCRAEGR